MTSIQQHSKPLSPRTRDAIGIDRRAVVRKAQDIIRHLPLEGLTWSKRDHQAGMYVWECGAMAWYALDEYSISAVCWAAYRHIPRNGAAVREAASILTEEAKAGLRPSPDWWIEELAARRESRRAA